MHHSANMIRAYRHSRMLRAAQGLAERPDSHVTRATYSPPACSTARRTRPLVLRKCEGLAQCRRKVNGPDRTRMRGRGCELQTSFSNHGWCLTPRSVQPRNRRRSHQSSHGLTRRSRPLVGPLAAGLSPLTTWLRPLIVPSAALRTAPMNTIIIPVAQPTKSHSPARP